MNYDNLNNDVKNVINNEYDFSNIVPAVESILYLVQYCSNVYNQFLKLIDEDIKRNEKLKYEFQNYNYKKNFSTWFEILIKAHSYSNNIVCNDFYSFQSAVNNGNLKNVKGLEIKLNLSYRRGGGNNFNDYENSFVIKFNPYEITFLRKSNHDEINMNQIENNIISILNKFSVVNSIFCTK